MNELFSLDMIIDELAAQDIDFQEGLDWQQTDHPQEAAIAFKRALEHAPDSAVVWTFYAGRYPLPATRTGPLPPAARPFPAMRSGGRRGMISVSI